MKKLFIALGLLICCGGCTIIKIYSGNPPYYLVSTEVYLEKDSGDIDIDSIYINGGEPYLVIQHDGDLYDIGGRRIK